MPGFEIFDDVVDWKKGPWDEENVKKVVEWKKGPWTWDEKSVKKAEEEWKEELLQLGELALGDPPVTENGAMYEDVFVPELFNCSPALMNKTSDFAYFPDFFHGMHNMSIFDINSTKVEAFNLGTCENPKNISIASEVTSEERKKLEEILKKYARVFAWSYEDMPGVDRSIT